MGLLDEEGAYCSGMMATAGALTLASPMMSFILAMVHFLEWQNKLLREIEQVCGGKCPEWTDKENLPLLQAVVKEILRWRPPVPTGMALLSNGCWPDSYTFQEYLIDWKLMTYMMGILYQRAQQSMLWNSE